MAGKEELFYVLECTARNCRAEFHLNDFPLATRGGDWGHFHGETVNEYVINGLNTISAVIEPGPSPGNALTGENKKRQRRVPAGDAEVSARLGAYPKGAVIGGPDCKELAAIQWKAEGDRPLFFPIVRSAAVDIAPPFGTWPWQAFPKIILNDDLKKEIAAFIKELHTAFSGAMPEPFIEASAHRFQDFEVSNHLDAGKRQGQVSKILKEIMDDISWGMEPLDNIEPDLRLCAEGRMVELIATDWQAVLRSKPDEESGAVYYFKMMISKVGGEWQIIR